MSPKNQIKTGVKEGAGRQPGYLWSVGILDVAHSDGASLLTKDEYTHMALQARELAREENPSHSKTVDVKRIVNEDFFELRDKGGPLGGKNARLFFAIDHEIRWLIILGLFLKQNNGSTPNGQIKKIRRRLRHYRNGDFGTP